MSDVAAALRDAAARLAATSDTARLDAELLMAHALGTARSDMLLRHMGDPVPHRFAALLERRAMREPVAYITGEQEFFGRAFAVDSRVLIPRPDSETLVEAALERIPVGADGRALDLGTGSGALLLTLLAERPGMEGIGLDSSAGAVAVASENARNLGLQARARTVRGDWRESGWAAGLGRFDIVLANPPYVEKDAALEPDVRHYEPANALFAGPDGLDDYRVLIPQLRALLSPGGIALFEIGARQGEVVTALARASGWSVELLRDLADRPRAVVLV